jgi:hypothetical protein
MSSIHQVLAAQMKSADRELPLAILLFDRDWTIREYRPGGSPSRTKCLLVTSHRRGGVPRCTVKRLTLSHPVHSISSRAVRTRPSML